MATWIGHLRIAEKLLPHFPELDRAMFAYGSLAPDFGRPLDDYQFSPTKEISHYMIRPADRQVFQDLIFYQDHLADPLAKADPPRYSFLLGYFFHLVCDNLWGDWIGQACKRDFSDMLEEMGDEAWWAMKDDWYGLDVQYAQANRDSIFWTEVMGMEDLPLYLAFQDQEAVVDQIKRIQKLNSDPPAELAERDRFPYLSTATMGRYIDESASFLLEYWQLIQEGDLPAEAVCIRDVFPGSRFAPYPSPLGEE